MDSNDAIFHLNASLIKYALNQIDDVLQCYRNAKEVEPDLELKPPYLARIAYAHYRAVKAGNSTVSRRDAFNLIEQALNDANRSVLPDASVALLIAALDELRSPPP
jgi:tetratricopeptide (TPR) repeat protein